MGLRILIKGYVMGLECIIKPAHQGIICPSKKYAACLTYVEVQTISRETIFGIAVNFPKAYQHIQWAARRMTFRECVRKALRDEREERREERLEQAQLLRGSSNKPRLEWGGKGGFGKGGSGKGGSGKGGSGSDKGLQHKSTLSPC